MGSQQAAVAAISNTEISSYKLPYWSDQMYILDPFYHRTASLATYVACFQVKDLCRLWGQLGPC